MENKIKKKILVVEDDKFLSELLAIKLNKEGFEALASINGSESLKLLKNGGIDLVLLDILLPGMSGFDVLSEIKKDPKTKNIPVIILSNLGQKEDIEKGKKLGADDYMIKALNTLDEIVGKVRQILH